MSDNAMRLILMAEVPRSLTPRYLDSLLCEHRLSCVGLRMCLGVGDGYADTDMVLHGCTALCVGDSDSGTDLGVCCYQGWAYWSCAGSVQVRTLSAYA
eukprot:46560-Rhodomonas_salina.2